MDTKVFKVSDFFDIHPTKAYKLTNRKLMDSTGTVPVLTNTSTDNGIGGWSKLNPTEKGPMITFSDTTTGPDTLFVQMKPFIGYSHVQGLYPKEGHTWTELELLYMVVAIKAGAGTGWSYATKFNRKLVSDFDIELPVTPDGTPDFAYMTEYIRELEADRIRELEAYLEVTGLNDTKLSASEAQALTKQVCWKRFKIGDIFKIAKGRRLTKAQQLPGNTPFIGSSATNHGVTGHIGQDPIFEANTLTISYNGSVGNVFYQTQPYWASDDINVLSLKDTNTELTPEVGNYMAGCLAMAGKGFGYTRKWNVARMKETDIMLPVTLDNHIDFEYMQDYIRATEKQVIKDVVAYKDRVIEETKRVVNG